MPTTTAQKLKLKPGNSIFVINEPAGYKKSLGALPAKVKILPDDGGADQLHWFVTHRAQMEKELPKVLKLLKENVTLWIFYPKGTSKIQTDLTRDKGWEKLLALDLQWLSLISFDETWSAFACRQKNEADKKKEVAPKHREIFDYIDPAKKTVRLPDDLAATLKKNKKEETFFHSLSFTNRKEYVEWIITAKREETRNERVKGTIERLAKGWKNPQNR